MATRCGLPHGKTNRIVGGLALFVVLFVPPGLPFVGSGFSRIVHAGLPYVGSGFSRIAHAGLPYVGSGFSRIVHADGVPSLATGQVPAQDDVWAPFRPLVGRWTGPSHGQAGDGTTERTCEFVLAGKFLQCRNKGTYPPQEKNKAGEVHEDVGFISYDKARKTFVLRQFHVEGFVNQYALDRPASKGDPLTFTTEAIENIAPGWRARETYRIGPDEWSETFALAAPGKEFETYSECRLRRTR